MSLLACALVACLLPSAPSIRPRDYLALPRASPPALRCIHLDADMPAAGFSLA